MEHQMVEIRLLVDCKNHLGENPLWDVAEERLYWVDSTGCEIWTCRADGSEVSTRYVPDFIGSMALRRGGGAILALAVKLEADEIAHGLSYFGPIMSSGRTMRSKSAPSMPSFTASSRSVVPFLCAVLAILAARS